MSRWRYPALALFTGAAVTVFEFAAPNLFRAYFGQTTYVWANAPSLESLPALPKLRRLEVHRPS